jgi:hypothetical protein
LLTSPSPWWFSFQPISTYIHAAGTRGPLDLVEVPSHTLELFASDPRVLSLFARHRGSGEALPPGLLAKAKAARGRFAALEQQAQVGGVQRRGRDSSARRRWEGGGNAAADAALLASM